MSTLGIKQYGSAEAGDFVDMAWADIAMHCSGRMPPLLAVTGAAKNDDRTFFCLKLAERAASRGHRVLLVDLDKTAVRFRKRLEHGAIRGFADFLRSLFDEPFLSRHIDDYGFNDLLTLLAFKKRSGKIVFRHEKSPSVTLELLRGAPIRLQGEGIDTDAQLKSRVADEKTIDRDIMELKLAKADARPLPLIDKLARLGIASDGELALLHEEIMARALTEVAHSGYVTFDLTDSKGNIPSLPPVMSRVKPACGLKPERDGFMRSLLDRLTIRTKQGFAFLPLGHFPLREKDFTARAPTVFRLFSAIYGQIIVNLPVFDGGIALQAGKLADGTVLVIKSGSIERRVLGKTVSALRESGANLIGAVLTDAPAECVGEQKTTAKT